MNKLILISALLVATLSAVYASPYSSQERLLSLLENARQEQADKQEEIGALARTAWWGNKTPPKEKDCKSVRIRLEKEKDQLKVQICTHSTFVYHICSGYVEEVPEEPVTVQRRRCKGLASLRDTIRGHKDINSALEMFVSDSQPSICAYLETVQQLCGVPEPVEGDEDQDY